MTPSQIVSALHTLLDVKQPAFLWGAPRLMRSRKKSLASGSKPS